VGKKSGTLGSKGNLAAPLEPGENSNAPHCLRHLIDEQEKLIRKQGHAGLDSALKKIEEETGSWTPPSEDLAEKTALARRALLQAVGPRERTQNRTRSTGGSQNGTKST
jgi:hypothetical protein